MHGAPTGCQDSAAVLRLLHSFWAVTSTRFALVIAIPCLMFVMLLQRSASIAHLRNSKCHESAASYRGPLSALSQCPRRPSGDQLHTRHSAANRIPSSLCPRCHFFAFSLPRQGSSRAVLLCLTRSPRSDCQRVVRTSIVDSHFACFQDLTLRMRAGQTRQVACSRYDRQVSVAS